MQADFGRDNVRKDLLTAIDFGTHGIKVLIARREGGRLCILGCGEEPVNGTGESFQKNIWKGTVEDFDVVPEKLRQAVLAAEEMANVPVEESVICLGMSGARLSTEMMECSRNLPGLERLVTEEFAEGLHRQARDMAYENYCRRERFMLCSVTSSYFLDNGREVQKAVGTNTSSLKLQLLSVLCGRCYHQDMIRMVTDQWAVDTSIALYVPMALGYAAVATGTVSAGSMFVSLDIGEGVTSYAVHNACGAKSLGQIPVGCSQIANDLSRAFCIDYATARQLLLNFGSSCGGSVMHPADGRQRLMEVDSRSGRRNRRIPISSVEKVIALRLEEIFQLVKEKLRRDRVWFNSGNVVVLSGGGAMIAGAVELAGQILGRDVRKLAFASSSAYDFPGEYLATNCVRWGTALGLLRQGMQAMDIDAERQGGGERGMGVWQKVRRMFRLCFHW